MLYNKMLKLKKITPILDIAVTSYDKSYIFVRSLDTRPL